MLRTISRHLIRRFYSKVAEVPKSADLLKKFMRDRIRTSGPLTIADYMSLATKSAAGYYPQHASDGEIFGEQGDFITSPELSQAFGELIGIWVYNELTNSGQRGDWKLVELGPGTGTLAADVLRTLHTLKVRKKDIVHVAKDILYS